MLDRRALPALLVLSLLACEGGSGTTPPPPPGDLAKLHRAAPQACSMDRPPGPMPGSGRGMCMTDADCSDATQGKNGRCVFARIGAICTYDTCFDDSACAGKVCACRQQADMASGDTNHCLTMGNCRVDADCGSGGSCSPTLGSCGHYTGIVGYYCHTGKDACINDSDCAQDGGLGGYCAYNPAAGAWQCSTAECAG